MTNPILASSLASSLLEIGAVVLRPDDPFTWASGIKSPIYCDNRLTLSYPSLRKTIAKGFVDILMSQDQLPEVIVGTATAGIPHAAWVADLLDLPMAYVRSKAKKHGKANQIEGLLEEGDRVVVIEDLISTGLSSLNAVDALAKVGAYAEQVLAIFSYGLPKAKSAFSEAAVDFKTLTNYDVLLEVAVEEERITADDLSTLKAWKQDPASWRA